MRPPKECGLTSAECRAWLYDWSSKAGQIFPDEEMLEYNGMITAFILWNRSAYVGRTRLQEYVNFVGVRHPALMVRRVMHALRLMFEKLPTGNPADRLTITLRQNKLPLPAITHPQFLQFREYVAADPFAGEYYRYFVTLLWHTGMSKRDAAHLEWTNVDLDQLLIRGQRRKNATPFTIPFVQDGELHQLLLAQKAMPENERYVSQAMWRRLHENTHNCQMEVLFQKACRHVGLPRNSGSHSFRRAFITRMIQAGVRDHQITKISGHRGTAMLATYYKPTDEDLRKAIAIIQDQPHNPTVLPAGSA